MADQDSSQLDLFTGAPSPVAPKARRGKGEPVGPAVPSEDVRALGEQLPPGLHLGTSSWTFPGWKGLVYDREATPARLSREGLAAYAQHPVLRTVGVDRTFYAPISAATFAEYAAQVPPGFRFLVKAHEACTLARWPLHARYGDVRGQPNERFLDAAYATEFVVAPCVEGLGERAGPIVFQLPPQDVQELGGVAPFVERLHAFLSALPRGPLYAVEVRNEALLTDALAQALADVGAAPVLAVWKNMPPVERQAVRLRALQAPALVARWMLPPNLDYEEARRRYFPFDRLVDEDVRTRDALARVSAAALNLGRPVFITLNNKAEGSAPLSAVQLARSVMSRNRNTPGVGS
ncbi:DUF72 domain-containing protein [Melittangium boletus]|uniref:DUF72 domain-containing protein n=1 Tax=Melittangium boletus DSM 14713 TaxID=1294270 RepID=A0A250ITF9_9BACT|nr:DUF72 domain-containing protein [Melittangium boletus]ATB34558.1 hypothetical protein MEBOL_008063 [Melittangium boletus DSM 14713]